MSTEFFDVMEHIEKSAKQVKFLDGSYPAVCDKYIKHVAEISVKLSEVEDAVRKDLTKFVKTAQTKQAKLPKRKRIQKP